MEDQPSRVAGRGNRGRRRVARAVVTPLIAAVLLASACGPQPGPTPPPVTRTPLADQGQAARDRQEQLQAERERVLQERQAQRDQAVAQRQAEQRQQLADKEARQATATAVAAAPVLDAGAATPTEAPLILAQPVPTQLIPPIPPILAQPTATAVLLAAPATQTPTPELLASAATSVPPTAVPTSAPLPPAPTATSVPVAAATPTPTPAPTSGSLVALGGTAGNTAPSTVAVQSIPSTGQGGLGLWAPGGQLAPGQRTGDPQVPDGVWLPISRVVIDRILLDTDVVASKLVQRAGGASWTVPAFTAGHAQQTGGAGAAGNAVLFGHVSSLRSGDVFRDLVKVQLGDVITVYGGTRRFDYRVSGETAVSRTDISVLQPTSNSTLTLVTCMGTWLPDINDFSERLVVRAELMPPVGAQ